MPIFCRALITIVFIVAIASCVQDSRQEDKDAAVEETADEFVARVNDELVDLFKEVGAALWVRATYITPDTAIVAAKTQERLLEFQSRIAEESKRYNGQEISADAARSIMLMKLGAPNPAPNDAEKRAELAALATDLPGMYGAGRYCPDGEGSCRQLQELEKVLAESRDYEELLHIWQGWRTVSPPMRDKYTRFVELANQGARELGFDDLGVMWKSNYEMSPAEFETETEHLWNQVKPLYKALHCYVRKQLSDHYGEDKVPLDQPIPAHLVGNMWAQEWTNIYDLVQPYEGGANLDVGAALNEQGYDAERMTGTAENFFVSVGLPELPETFWERSMLTKPRDRDVVCHASAWPLDGGNDVRIKQCVEINEEHLNTLHHELGHIYYFLMYKDQPPLYQDGAHSGFHEGIGDTMQLSMTPAYLKEIGLMGSVEVSDKAVINQLMKSALEKIAFLPFGKLIDQWRWDVFSGNTTPEEYNSKWWQLRTQYQGIAAPVERSEANFDPGAKYHIPANVSYTRYFLARILQFQFHRALCEASGHEGPLHECSIYGNKEAGKRLGDMMALGASQPWPDTLETLTGTREMDASAIIDYFAPLMMWLDEQNEGLSCGW